jgi:hypothetical protein
MINSTSLNEAHYKLSHLESAQSNYVQTKGKFTCYYCKEDGHIKPNLPKLQAGVPKTDDK